MFQIVCLFVVKIPPPLSPLLLEVNFINICKILFLNEKHLLVHGIW